MNVKSLATGMAAVAAISAAVSTVSYLATPAPAAAEGPTAGVFVPLP